MTLRAIIICSCLAMAGHTFTMDFAGPINQQDQSLLSVVPDEFILSLLPYDCTRSSVRMVLNLQQACRLWCTKLDDKTKKKIVNSWCFDGYSVSDDMYDQGLVATLSLFTNSNPPEYFAGKVPEVFLLVKANPNYIHQVNGSSYSAMGLLINNAQSSRADSILQPLRLLIRCGADVNLPVSGGCTPLHYAAAQSHMACFKLLLQQKAQVNQRDHRDDTPLHWAVGALAVENIKLLLAYGADPSFKNTLNRTPAESIPAVSAIWELQTICHIMNLLCKAADKKG